jgi:hypothetical protein
MLVGCPLFIQSSCIQIFNKTLRQYVLKNIKTPFIVDTWVYVVSVCVLSHKMLKDWNDYTDLPFESKLGSTWFFLAFSPILMCGWAGGRRRMCGTSCRRPNGMRRQASFKAECWIGHILQQQLSPPCSKEAQQCVRVVLWNARSSHRGIKGCGEGVTYRVESSVSIDGV